MKIFQRAAVVIAAVSAMFALLIVARAATHSSPADDAGETRLLRYLMGTAVRVESYGGTSSERQAAADEAFGAIAEVDRLMSDYRSDSELTVVNQNAAAEPVPVSDPLFAVLKAAERVSRASDGTFDITVGPLIRLWGFKDKRPHIPSSEELDRVRPLVGFHNLMLDERTHSVRFRQPGVQLDLGGIAKGFAVEVAAASLTRRGLSGVIDAGGNQFMVGIPPGKQQWTVGISSPDAPDQLLGSLDVPAGAVSTSSDASNFLTANGERYGHLLDPRTLRPSTASLSVTIVSPDGTLSDALSKAVFALGPHDGLALLNGFPETRAVVAFRQTDGTIGVAVSRQLASAFHRARTT